jgi:hypothetical protein
MLGDSARPNKLAWAHPHPLKVLLDTRRCQTAPALHIPQHVIVRFQPPHSPAVHPAARVWEARKDALAWQCLANLAVLQPGSLISSRRGTPPCCGH